MERYYLEVAEHSGHNILSILGFKWYCYISMEFVNLKKENELKD
jgi:hypothetical protein